MGPRAKTSLHPTPTLSTLTTLVHASLTFQLPAPASVPVGSPSKLSLKQPSDKELAGRSTLRDVPQVPSRGALLVHSSNLLDDAGFTGSLDFPASLPFSHTGVPWDHFPNKLTTDSLLPGLLLEKPRPRHCLTLLGLQELLSNSSLRGCTLKGQRPLGISHIRQAPSLSPPRLTLTT